MTAKRQAARGAGAVLVVAAHPDDEVLGCGGTIARLAASRPTHLAILGEGLNARYSGGRGAPRRALHQLKQQARIAAALMGVRDVTFEGLPDNRFDQMPLLEVVKRVERIVARVRPSVVYTHHPGDLNVDHGITFRAVLTATRPLSGCPVRALYAFEVPSSTEWSFQRVGQPFCPNVFQDISETIDVKVRALDAYTGEVRPFPHPRSAEAIRALARRWGSVAGCGYAEAFELIRSMHD